MSKESKESMACLKRLEMATATNKTVHRLIDALEGLGCKIPTDFLVCRQCPPGISGGFAVQDPSREGAYKPQIIMCENGMLEKETFEHTVVHELVHAYDQCRAKIDWSNCLHHACTEVRASALSGECNLLHEIFRGNTTIRNGRQECVRRRAQKSVAMNSFCKELAADAVDVVFDQCYQDTSPLDFESNRTQ